MRLSQQTDIGIERKDRAEIEVETLRDGCSFRHSSERSPKGSCGPKTANALLVYLKFGLIMPSVVHCRRQTGRNGRFPVKRLLKASAPEGVWNLLVGGRK